MTPACTGIVASPLHHDRGVRSVRSLFLLNVLNLLKPTPAKSVSQDSLQILEPVSSFPYT